jgi:hypothetical protein
MIALSSSAADDEEITSAGRLEEKRGGRAARGGHYHHVRSGVLDYRRRALQSVSSERGPAELEDLEDRV